MTKELAKRIAYAIDKECSRYSLTEWCEEWEFTLEEYDEFLQAAIDNAEEQS